MTRVLKPLVLRVVPSPHFAVQYPSLTFGSTLTFACQILTISYSLFLFVMIYHSPLPSPCPYSENITLHLEPLLL